MPFNTQSGTRMQPPGVLGLLHPSICFVVKLFKINVFSRGLRSLVVVSERSHRNVTFYGKFRASVIVNNYRNCNFLQKPAMSHGCQNISVKFTKNFLTACSRSVTLNTAQQAMDGADSLYIYNVHNDRRQTSTTNCNISPINGSPKLPGGSGSRAASISSRFFPAVRRRPDPVPTYGHTKT
jgi:hypothetical protein